MKIRSYVRLTRIHVPVASLEYLRSSESRDIKYRQSAKHTESAVTKYQTYRLTEGRALQ
jgi:hypothetical protein